MKKKLYILLAINRYNHYINSVNRNNVTEGTDYDWRGGGDSRHTCIGVGRRRYGS
jgi:hypothetical protein